MGKLKALGKVYIIDAFDNKFVFIYTLLFPALYFIYVNFEQIIQRNQYSASTIVATFRPFWAYIVFIALLNMVIITTIDQRESGYYKEFYFIVGSKWLIFIANFIVQSIFIICELTVFTIFGMIALRSWYFSILISGLLTGILAVIPVTMFLSVLFIFKVKQQSLSIIGTLLVCVLIYLAGLPSRTWLTDLILLLNPYKYILVLSNWITSFTVDGSYDFKSLFQLLFVTLFFCLSGVKGFSKLDILPLLDRV
ncbi:hypothetical protein JCM15457_404 [Liquorilactobacillus sucicola DSM 21376 = JCM 15457]|uniref:Uncharacterized protein n=1 Tax=Liquorilactobacillus sucicola DSM 21376 = JCM 15457 TaxID=1423806 RepID=A0A023CUI2_9LACO|nr:hypothetical protein [Liquorilactobacillus sucicola]KRN05459.1 hypothetical protein FD15_GL002014 [Liquorilactobacillus sucicola DSM 21376 = JCM 15457]GAJ25537.1 hypothetical protein JCM15457_404 [Liquorilactobacillus sucicola DSM 21376 = JCM 15457]